MFAGYHHPASLLAGRDTARLFQPAGAGSQLLAVKGRRPGVAEPRPAHSRSIGRAAALLASMIGRPRTRIIRNSPALMCMLCMGRFAVPRWRNRNGKLPVVFSQEEIPVDCVSSLFLPWLSEW